MRYSVRRPKSLDLFSICLFIKFFEGYITRILDQLQSLNGEAIKKLAESLFTENGYFEV